MVLGALPPASMGGLQGPADNDPIWCIAREECSPACLSVLWPFVGALLGQSRFVDVVGRERLRPLFRCISQLHERSQLSEASAQHWKEQWYGAYGQALDQNKKVDSVYIESQVANQDLKEALAAMSVEKDRFAQEVARLNMTLRSACFLHADQDREQECRLVAFQGAANHQLDLSAKQHRELLQRLEAERAAALHLQSEVRRLSMELAAECAVRKKVEEQLGSAEENKFVSRLDEENRVRNALYEQRKLFEAESRRTEEEFAKERNIRSRDPTLQEALRTLELYADLWRCACTPYAGLHGRRAEQAVQELAHASGLLKPNSELVQEPLRRALGEAEARRLAGELVDGGVLSTVTAGEARGRRAFPGSSDGSWCRWDGATLPRNTLFAQPPILLSENR